MNAEMITSVVVAALSSVALSTFISGWFGRKFVKAEANTTIADNAIKFNDQLAIRIDKLENTLESNRKESAMSIEILRKENIELHKQIASLQTEVNIYRQYMPKVV